MSCRRAARNHVLEIGIAGQLRAAGDRVEQVHGIALHIVERRRALARRGVGHALEAAQALPLDVVQRGGALLRRLVGEALVARNPLPLDVVQRAVALGDRLAGDVCSRPICWSCRLFRRPSRSCPATRKKFLVGIALPGLRRGGEALHRIRGLCENGTTWLVVSGFHAAPLLTIDLLQPSRSLA